MLKKIWKNKLTIICLLILAGIIILNSLVASYTVLVDDDFWYHQPNLIDVGLFSFVKNALSYTKRMVLTWQGTFLAFFLQCLLDPVYNGGMVHLRVQMILFSFMFWLSFYLCVNVIFSYFIKDKKDILIIVTVFVLFFCSMPLFTEIFTWRTGAIGYLVPIAFALLSVILYSLFGKKRWVSVIMLGLAFCSGGGSLMVSAFNCFLWLWVNVLDFIKEKKITLGAFSGFVACLLGTLCNIFSPGNFLRQKYISDAYHSSSTNIVETLQDTLHLFVVCEKRFFNMDSLFFLCLLLIIGYYIKNKTIISKLYIVFSTISLLFPLVLLFPIVYGYGSPRLPNRCSFVVYLSLILIWGNFICVIGTCIPKKTVLKIVLPFFMVAAILLNFSNSYSIKDMGISKMIIGLMNGEIADYYDEYVDMLAYLETQKDKDVVLPREVFPSPTEYLHNFSLYEENDTSVNSTLSDIYNLKSLIMYE